MITTKKIMEQFKTLFNTRLTNVVGTNAKHLYQASKQRITQQLSSIKKASLILLLVAGGNALFAAELNVQDGVVVKFGQDAQLVVRDKLISGKGVVFTSEKDDATSLPLSATAQTPAQSDWAGVNIEKSSAAYGALTLDDVEIKYADTALSIRGWSPTLTNLHISDSLLGLNLLDGANSAISNSTFFRNGTAVSVENSLPTISASQLFGNTTQAVLNKTPASVVVARGNWWGDVSGPNNATANPSGLGNGVSDGVDFGDFLNEAPLLNPSIKLAAPANYFEQRNIEFELACINAVEYRIAEGNSFVGVPFTAFNNAGETVTYSVSENDGLKPITAQFRNSAGTIVTATLNGGILVDTQAPTVAITNPANGSVIGDSITIEATATDGSGIKQVEFYVDDVLASTRVAAPYTYNWDVTDVLDGNHTFKVIATDQADKVSEATSSVELTRAPPVPDTEGPQITNITANNAAFSEGATLTDNTTFRLTASDRSGISKIELLLDGTVVNTFSGSNNYATTLNLTNVADGPYTLVVRATDSINNVTSTSYNVVVAHAVPTAPQLISPSNGTVTRTASMNVTGSAQAGSAVQLILNGQPAGSPITVASNGGFGGTVTLIPGDNTIQATATDQYGTSAPSATVQVNLDVTVPASPSNLTSVSSAQGKVRLTWTRSTDPNAIGYNVYRASVPFSTVAEAVKINSSRITAYVYDDLPPQDGTWYYRVVAVNAAGTLSEPTNETQAVSDNALPTASIVYTPQGNVDSATGRIGQGRVDLILTVSEPLQVVPYLAVVPEAASPITVELTKTSDTTYTGFFTIDATTATGTANAIFSARDLVGNRGTDVSTGATLNIDTQGPDLSGITLDPGTPIKNDTQQTVQATFTFSEPLAGAAVPKISYVLSGPVRSPIEVTGLTKTNATTWQASFTLPTDAGLPDAEIFSFSTEAVDDLGNISTKVTAFNRYQVYQNSLPPLDIPFALTAKALPAGKVQLDWQVVEGASGYVVYRQAPDEAALQELIRTTSNTLVDQTEVDGAYQYSVASVRQSNGEESLSGQSAAVDVNVSATAPGIPQNLTVQLAGQGNYLTWQAPPASNVASYNLYRSTGTSINSIDGLTPYKTGIRQLATIDTNPSPTEGAYVVTALDPAGNESAISNSVYLNSSLLPVKNLKVEQIGNNLPVVSWTAPNGNLSGYLVYVGEEPNKTQLTASQITATNYTDSGFTSGERAYTVSSVDANGVELPHSILLPNVAAQIASGLPVKRGIMNKLQVQVVNLSDSTVSNARAVVTLPINKDSTAFKDHKSAPVSIAPNETKLVDVIVGGYADLPTQAQAQVGLEIVPFENELVKISRDETIDVIDGALVVGIATQDFTRGGTGKVKLTIENTSEVDVELLTATANGANPSSELRFKILDNDGNVLATQAYKQVFGSSVITLTNGETVARIPAGSSYVSDVFNVNVPASSPSTIKVRLEVDKLRYHTTQADAISIAGRGSEKTVSLVDTTYFGEVTNVTPLTSFGDEDIVITGRAVDRQTSAQMPNTRLTLILNQQGFERTFEVLTDAAGNFTYNFTPTVTDSGLYKVSAVHPDITDRPEQKAFTINKVTVTPTPYRLDIPRNYQFNIPFKAKAGTGSSATNLTLALNAASQVGGVLPEGVNLDLPAPINISSKQTLNIPVVFTANNTAADSGSVVLDVMSESTLIGKVQVNYTLSEAKPFLVPTPSLVETGLSQGGSELESLVVTNKGLQDALNAQFTLTNLDNSPAPSWVNIANQPNGTIAIGESRSVDITFNPPAGTQEQVYEFKLTVQADNVPAQSLSVFASVTQSGQGSALFKVSDIYTATLDAQGELILGLQNATITVENEDVATITSQLTTDSVGEAFFQNLPAGRYKFRAKAANHQELGGRFQIKPGITINQPVFLDYNLVTVEWSVREITIEDRYDITLNATFETNVPAAVVVLSPASVNLPEMNPGDVYNGELTLTNHGLVRADNVKQTLPSSDGYYRYEFLVDVPTTLEAKQSITIPYRVIAIQSIDAASSASTAGGAGCYNYSNLYRIGCNYVCANGTRSSACGSQAGWFRASGTTCTGTGGSGGSGTVYRPGGDWGVSGAPQGIQGPPPCAKCEGGGCCTR